MKTRIKVLYRKNGTAEYYPQYKFLCFWLGFPSQYSWKGKHEWFYYPSEARKYIREIMKLKQSKDNLQVIKTDYIDYI